MNGAFTQEKLKVNGVQLTMLTAGTGEPLVFLHGAGIVTGFDFALSWAKKYRVMIPYHPGFGLSADDVSISSMHDYVMHYLDFFDQLGLAQFNLVGFSMGGWMAAAFATEHSHRLRKLVLLAPAGLHVPKHPTADLFRITPEELPSYLAVNPDLVMRHLPRNHSPDFAAAMYREQTSAARIAWDRFYDPKLSRWLHRVSAPTLLVWGDQDRFVPAAQAETWMSLLPRADLRVIPNAGHLLFDDQPEAADCVTTFLA
jgi:pimeloyl-ACP methyl ester carboxylesterase